MASCMMCVRAALWTTNDRRRQVHFFFLPPGPVAWVTFGCRAPEAMWLRLDPPTGNKAIRVA